ncbi:cyclophilin-like fold protein [Neobacillus cucumis]|nr:cyclophilin-like fold protein [Neobacillus cucumis]MCM3728404.1 cyclophilin-like fold protein [Neobacillus cucumis]
MTKDDAPLGCNVSVVDFMYYSPWGNSAIFYRVFAIASGLIILGMIESGIEKIAIMKGNHIINILYFRWKRTIGFVVEKLKYLFSINEGMLEGEEC